MTWWTGKSIGYERTARPKTIDKLKTVNYPIVLIAWLIAPFSMKVSVQVETQRFVSELQAYNGMLQAAPGLLFTLVAGPLTDTWGRPGIVSGSLNYQLFLPYKISCFER